MKAPLDKGFPKPLSLRLHQEGRKQFFKSPLGKPLAKGVHKFEQKTGLWHPAGDEAWSAIKPKEAPKASLSRSLLGSVSTQIAQQRAAEDEKRRRTLQQQQQSGTRLASSGAAPGKAALGGGKTLLG